MLEQLQLKLAQVLSVSYVRDVNTAKPTVVRGQIQIGQSAGWKDAPDNTVVLQVKQPNLNADEWQTLLASFTEEESGLRVGNAGRSSLNAYVPNKIDISSQELVWSNMALHWHPEPHRVLAEWNRLLKPETLVMFSCLGPGSFAELRSAMEQADLGTRTLEFVDMHDFGDLLLEIIRRQI